MHAAGIEFDNAFFVGEATEANTVVLRIIFRTVDDFESGIKRIASTVELMSSYSKAGYSRQVRIIDSVVAAATCDAAGNMSGTGIRQVTVTVSYTPLSATGTNAISGTRSVSVTMQIAQR